MSTDGVLAHLAGTTHTHAGSTGPGAPGGWWPAAVVVVVGGGLVALGVVRVARSGRRVRPARLTALVVGLLVVGAALTPPLAAAAHGDLRAHMVQHLLVGMYGPLLLALGGPVTLLLAAASPDVRRVVGAVVRSWPVRVLGHPVPAGVLSASGLYVLYLTELYALSHRSGVVHVLVHVHLLLAGYLLAWSIAGTDPAPHRPGLGLRLAVLVLTAAAHAHLAKLLYARAPDLSAGVDQPAVVVQEAARWMYYGGDVAEVALAVALMAGWYRVRRVRARAPRTHGAPPTGADVRRTSPSPPPARG